MYSNVEHFNGVFITNILCSEPEPTKRDLDNICAYIYNGEIRNGECTTAERVICEKDGKWFAFVIPSYYIQLSLTICIIKISQLHNVRLV